MAKKLMPKNVVQILAKRVQDEIKHRITNENEERMEVLVKSGQYKLLDTQLKKLNEMFTKLKEADAKTKALLDEFKKTHSTIDFDLKSNVKLISDNGYTSYLPVYVLKDDTFVEPKLLHYKDSSVPSIEELISKITLEDYFSHEGMSHDEFVNLIADQYA